MTWTYIASSLVLLMNIGMGDLMIFRLVYVAATGVITDCGFAS